MNIIDAIQTAYDWRRIWAENNYVDHRKYIQSPKWKRISREAKKRSGFHCQLCNSTKRLETHHRTYIHLGHEQPDDLIVLCHTCHDIFSKNGRLAK